MNNLNKRLKNIKDFFGKSKRKIAAGATAIYEGILGKYLYDLYNVFSDEMVRVTVKRGELPLYADLSPWPMLNKPYIPENLPMPRPLFTKPMSSLDYAIKFFYEHPILQVLAIAAPFIAWGVYYGIRRYKEKKEKMKQNIFVF